jgi:hypothetical protein
MFATLLEVRPGLNRVGRTRWRAGGKNATKPAT